MKKLLAIAAIFGICICTSCDSLTGGPDTNNTDNDINSNSLAGTTWEWSEEPITWTFTFIEKEVTIDYRAEFSPSDITTEQYKSTYEYNSGNIAFNITVWSGTEWKFTGTVDGDTMTLIDSGVEKINVQLTKK